MLKKLKDLECLKVSNSEHFRPLEILTTIAK